MRLIWSRMRIPRGGSYKILLLLVLLVLLGSTLVSDLHAWSANPPTIPGSRANLLNPDVYVDRSGFIHAVWLYAADGELGYGKVYYNRGEFSADGTSVTWSSAQRVTEDNATNPGSARIAVSDNGTVHIAYMGRDSRLYYLRNTERGRSGAWTKEVLSSQGGFTVDIEVDEAGIPYIVWGRGVNPSQIRLAYRASASNWIGKEASQSTYLTRRPKVAISGSGDSALVHVVYEYQREENGQWRVGYARGTRSGNMSVFNFSESSLGLGAKADFPGVAVDRETGYVYIGFIYDEASGYSFVFTESRDRGNSWATPRRTRINTQTWPGAPSISAGGGSAHIALEQKVYDSGFRDLWIYYERYRASSRNYERVRLISDSGERSTLPNMSVGARGKAAVWVNNNVERARINTDPGGVGPVEPTDTPTPENTPTNTPTPTKTNTPSPTPTNTPIPKPVGSIALIGDLSADRTAGLQVQARLDVRSGTANEYRLSNDENNWSPWEALPGEAGGVVNWTLSETSGNQCQFRTVYAQLHDTRLEAGQDSDVFDASIEVDPGVDAQAFISNPFLTSNGLSLQDFGGDGGGASNGDPGYTRQMFYYGRVTANDGECTGLADVQFGQMTPVALNTNVSGGTFPIADFDLADGDEYNVQITVKDGANNERTFSDSIILDQTPPTVTNALSVTLAVMDRDGNEIAVSDSPFVNLSFEGVQIGEDVYQKDSNGQNFWGVWTTTSTEYITPTDESALSQLQALDWRPKEVASATSRGNNSYDFVLENLYVYQGLIDPEPGRTYYLYARILDGAGNASPEIMGPFEIELTENALPPRTYLPLVVK